jgi:hypothetical protein
MDDVGPFPGLEHELPRCFAEESKSVDIVMAAIKGPAIKEVVIRMGFDEKALPAVYKSVPYGTVYRSSIPRDPDVSAGN